MAKAVFLDRDGVLIEDAGLVTALDQVRILPGVPEALRLLKAAGYLLVVVSNQAVVARGLLTEDEMQALHRSIEARLQAAGAPPLDGFYACPHHPRATLEAYRVDCDCRKPRPGLILRAAAEAGIDLARSYLVGDRPTDLVAGARAGCGTLWVQTGQHEAQPIVTTEAELEAPEPLFVGPGLLEAARWILAAAPGRPATLCQGCRTAFVEDLLDFGPQPIANRYLEDPAVPEATYPFRAGVCGRCGLVQLTALVPPAELQPRFPWISYNEPEDHLDHLAGILAGWADLNPGPVLGISAKDDTLLARLARLGTPCLDRLDAAGDLGIAEPQAGMETLQDRLTPARARDLAGRRGPARMVIARHILEHAHRTRGFLAALRGLLAPDGVLVLEVPDCGKALAAGDLTTLWEEHVVYFTEATLRSVLARAGLAVDQLHRYPYPFEDSLVAIVRGAPPGPAPVDPVAASEVDRARAFAVTSRRRGAALRRLLVQARDRGRRAALFGAGHLGIGLVNLLDLGPLLAFAVDDHTAKRGLCLPGSRLPVLGSRALVEEGVDLCLLACNPLAEARVLEAQHAFLARGGRFCSPFPGSRLAVPIDGDGGPDPG